MTTHESNAHVSLMYELALGSILSVVFSFGTCFGVFILWMLMKRFPQLVDTLNKKKRYKEETPEPHDKIPEAIITFDNIKRRSGHQEEEQAMMSHGLVPPHATSRRQVESPDVPMWTRSTPMFSRGIPRPSGRRIVIPLGS